MKKKIKKILNILGWGIFRGLIFFSIASLINKLVGSHTSYWVILVCSMIVGFLLALKDIKKIRQKLE